MEGSKKEEQLNIVVDVEGRESEKVGQGMKSY